MVTLQKFDLPHDEGTGAYGLGTDSWRFALAVGAILKTSEGA